jgi:hypothetical protein
MRSLTGLAGVLLLMGACQSVPGGGGTTRSSQPSIGPEELEALPAFTVFQAVERLKPSWLRGRVSTIRGASPSRYYAQVFVDGIPTGDLEVLKGMNVKDVREIRFYSASEATTRFGTGYPGGIIEVVTKRGGGGSGPPFS